MKYVVPSLWIVVTMQRCLWIVIFIAVIVFVDASSILSSDLQDYLSLGDQSLTNDEFDQAIYHYQQGINLFNSMSTTTTTTTTTATTTTTTMMKKENDNDTTLTFVVISLYTNMATSLSTIGRTNDAIKAYDNALLVYQEKSSQFNNNDNIQAKENNDDIIELKKTIAQTAFYLGMEYQDIFNYQKAIDAYNYSVQLDTNHWGAYSNLGSILYDNMKNYHDALEVYNKAYTILTDPAYIPTDPPNNVRPILSQLQYRIGLCISSSDLTKNKCTLIDDSDDTRTNDGTNSKKQQHLVDCIEMASHAFSLAIEYDPINSQAAKHMLATITADATMTRASNEYIISLFDDYATNFEHSLVTELKYDGYKRLRSGFNKALLLFDNNKNNTIVQVPIFNTVIDAGCGTGLVGEQFRNISNYLIGIDLSEAIVNQAIAVRPNLYNKTITGDVIDIFYTINIPIDLIIAGDSYIYFGNIQPLFKAMYYTLTTNGYIAFTLENVNIESEITLQQTKPNWKWQLTSSGRFAHNKNYIVDVASTYNLQLIYYEPLDGFRYEHGIGVRGHLFVFQKQIDSDTSNDNVEPTSGTIKNDEL